MSGHFKTQAIEAMKDVSPDVRQQNLQNFTQALRQFVATTKQMKFSKPPINKVV
jgi:hypothetical protein